MAAAIIVKVEGGMVQEVIKQDCHDTPVYVRDYDIEGFDRASLSEDEDGRKCIESEY